MTSSAFVPTNQTAPNLDVCIDKEGCGLMTDRTVLNVPIRGAFRVVSMRSTPWPRSLGHLARRDRSIRIASCPPRVAAQTTQYP
jgi:hypothetical protein